MELKATLNKPYTNNQKLDFIVKYNHGLGYEIKETSQGLEAWGLTDEEIKQKERERINMLSLTAADVERAIYKAKGMDFDDILEFVKANPPEGLDIKALKIELKANNFYRGNPYVEQIGTLLGYNSDDIDYLFINKELPVKSLDDVIEATEEAGLYDLPDVSLVDTSDQAEDLTPSAVIKKKSATTEKSSDIEEKE